MCCSCPYLQAARRLLQMDIADGLEGSAADVFRVAVDATHSGYLAERQLEYLTQVYRRQVPRNAATPLTAGAAACVGSSAAEHADPSTALPATLEARLQQRIQSQQREDGDARASGTTGALFLLPATRQLSVLSVHGSQPFASCHLGTPEACLCEQPYWLGSCSFTCISFLVLQLAVVLPPAHIPGGR